MHINYKPVSEVFFNITFFIYSDCMKMGEYEGVRKKDFYKIINTTHCTCN